jgi:polar amino acid transport system permease protein
MLLASSICSFISVPELSGSAAIVEQRTFRSFESYIIVTVAYLVIALTLKLGLIGLGHALFGKRVKPDVIPAIASEGSAA